MSVGLMFHSVGLRHHRWRSPQIAEDVAPFRSKLLALRNAGFQSVFFREWKPSVRRTVCLTFDDGYLDNWVHVFPVLQETGLKATVFVTTDFIDPRPLTRPAVPGANLDDATHHAGACCAGFLSWPEMRAMEESGLVEIQSHACTHTWYFSGPRIVDYWRPGSATRPGGPTWMLWNAEPARKPLYLTEADADETRIPYGTPIYEHGKALEVRRFFPDEPEVTRALQENVRDLGGASFFDTENWQGRLDALVEKVRDGRREVGTYEDDQAWEARIRGELHDSKRILEEGLGHEVPAIVWPGGGSTEQVLRIAREVGYRAFTLPDHLTVSDPSLLAGATIVPRVGGLDRVRWRGKDLGHPSGTEYVWYLRRAEGDVAADALVKMSKVIRYAGRTLRRLR